MNSRLTGEETAKLSVFYEDMKHVTGMQGAAIYILEPWNSC